MTGATYSPTEDQNMATYCW